MLDTIFASVFTDTLTIYAFLICICSALVLGTFIAFLYTKQSKYTKGYVVTLSILPAVVAMIIMMVNGNIGAGIAVAGAFSLCRFRSVPGTAKEIGSLFLAMGTGLAIGMGYIAFAAIFVVIVSSANMLLSKSNFGTPSDNLRTLKVTIPEELNYTDAFADLFETYTLDTSLTSVKTSNMGSLYKLTYDIELKDCSTEKALIDDMRCRNGNLEIMISKQASQYNEL